MPRILPANHQFVAGVNGNARPYLLLQDNYFTRDEARRRNTKVKQDECMKTMQTATFVPEREDVSPDSELTDRRCHPKHIKITYSIITELTSLDIQCFAETIPQNKRLLLVLVICCG